MKRSLSSIAVAAALLSAVVPVVAEEPRTFVVTASRVEEDALESPSQVTVITAEDIERSGAQSVVEALRSIAGIEFRSYSSDAQAEVSMRGFGENSSGRVLILVDGRRLNNPDMQTINWLSIPLADVERIEVLQGASSVRYGNNAVGGVINVITKKAQKGTTAKASFSVGSFSEYRAQAGVNVGGEDAGLTAAAERYETDGYRDRSGYGSTNVSARGRFDPAELLRLKGGVSYSDTEYQMPGSLSETQFEDDPSQATNTDDEAADRTFTAELGAEWTPLDTMVIDVPLSYSVKDIESDMASWGSFTNREVQTLQASPALSWDAEAASLPLRVVAGTDVSAAFLDVNTYSEKARTNKTNSFEVSQVSVGPFLTARLSLRDDLTLEGGVRYDRSTIAAENADESVDDSKTHEAFVYDAGVVYRPGKATKVYARFGTVFRYPFTDEQASLYGYGSDVFLTDLEAEKGYNLEAGVSTALNRLIRLDASAYLMNLEDEVAWFATGTYTGYNANLDKTRRVGADLALEARPVSYLSVRGAYGWVNAEFVNGDDKGNAVPLVPAHKLDAEITATVPFGLSVSPSASYRSEAYQGGDTANASEKIDAYAVYSLTVRFVPVALSGKLELTAKAENLLDAEYAPYVLDGGYYYPAAGRSFSMGVSYRY